MKISPAIWWSLAWLWAVTAGAAPTSDQKSAISKRAVPGAELFTNGPVLRIHLEIPASNLAALRKEPRKAVRAIVTEGTNVYSDVAVHVKGSAGSTRGVDEKPALTLSFGKFTPNQKFHGLRKIHLNNSVQDPTYMNENLCGEMFRGAGVPATRVCNALVEVNNKKFGLYVVKEGFTKEFLSLFFKKTNGNLYDMDPGHEVTEQLQRDSGDGPLDRLDLKALAAAAQEPDAAQRWQRLLQVLDMDRFISFAALELMANHWDGYCIGRNNFRVYHDRDTDKIVFFPHGMDQMFGDPNYAVNQRMNGLVAQAVLRTPQGRRLYRERVGTLFTNIFRVNALTNRVNELEAQIYPALLESDKNAAREFKNQAAGLRGRIEQRITNLEKLIALPEPKPLKFENGFVKVTGWRTQDEQGGAKLDEVKDPEGKPTLHIAARSSSASSWRSRVLLPGGRYRFEGLARTAGVVPVKDAKKGEGAGLRISGSEKPRANKLSGDAAWQKLGYEFEASSPEDEVELVCELRASKGEVWFDADSFRLVQLK